MPSLISFLHTLVVYTVVGTAVSFALSLAACAFFKIGKPAVKTKLFFLTLIVPLLAYLFHYFISPVLKLQHGATFFEPSNRVFAYLCSLGVLGSMYYLPLLLLIAFGLYRMGIYYWHCRKIAFQTLDLSAQAYRLPGKILSELANAAGVETPILKILKGTGYSCFTYGVFKPAIAISANLLDILSEEELQAVLSHELGHIAHRDSLLNWIAVALRDMSVYLPFTHLALRMLHAEQEFAADEFAINITRKPLIYSAALIKAWRKSKESSKAQIHPVPAFAAEARISDRVERVIRGETGGKQGDCYWLLLTIGIVTIAVLAYVC
ncbi:M56 family metallopeptidase [Zhaonella formicivorans]|uniref:M56 family metallopeptidase n=1 Tax=Zhaonella formicivorans TaxID=2528593 RepID=UPI0010E39A95|nr:M56 family metallopeptidase [Zhaonella formicivorans]